MEINHEFAMQVLSILKTVFQRQATEVVLIEQTKVCVILNNKGEWNGSKLSRVILEIGNKGEQKDYNGQ